MGPVEVFRTGPVVTVYADGLPVQAWAVDEWDELLAAIKADDDCLPEIEVLPTGDVWLGFQYSGRHEILSFTEAEWAEFVTGVRAGEFDIDKLSGPATHGCGAGQAGAPTADGAGQAATGAGGLPAAPAPVAADRPLPDAIAGNRRALSGPDREGIPSAQGSGLRPSPATGAGEVRAASSPPAPVAAEVLGPLPVKPCPMSGASSGHDAGLLTDGESVLPGAAHTHFSGPNVAVTEFGNGCNCTGCCNCSPTAPTQPPSALETEPEPPTPVVAVDEPSPADLRCPTCGSPEPRLHPAVQFEGEVSPCYDPWHRPVSGPNVASMNVPAGRPSPAPHQVIPPQEAGQPGPAAIATDVIATNVDFVRPDFLTGVDVEEWAREWAESAYGIGYVAGQSATQAEVDEAREWAKRTAPLVPEVIEASRSDADSEPGGASTHVGAATGGWKAGPGLTPVSPGPAEPTGGVS